MRINKSSNTLTLSISGCSSPDDRISSGNTNVHPVYFSLDASGILANIKSSGNEVASISIYDVMGRMVSSEKISLTSGITSYHLSSLHGTYFVKIESATIHFAQTVLFQ
jgi:hypothetical protein